MQIVSSLRERRGSRQIQTTPTHDSGLVIRMKKTCVLVKQYNLLVSLQIIE